MRTLLFAVAALSVGCRYDIDTPRESGECEDKTVDVCMNQAPLHSDFRWISDNILYKNCTSSACHQRVSSAEKATRLVFDDPGTSADPEQQAVDRAKRAYETLVFGLTDADGFPVDPNHPDPDHPAVGSAHQIWSDVVGNNDVPLVQPNKPNESYLYFIMKGVRAADFTPSVGKPPDEVGFMPRGNDTLCCQKLDAIERWILAGAHND